MFLIQFEVLLSFFTQNSSMDLGLNPVVARCFKSFYKRRPEFPRYMVTWDVGLVLNFLSSLASS